jgi:prophage tail gpP-like protein
VRDALLDLKDGITQSGRRLSAHPRAVKAINDASRDTVVAHRRREQELGRRRHRAQRVPGSRPHRRRRDRARVRGRLMSGYKSNDSLRRTFVFIEVNGESFDFWTDYSTRATSSKAATTSSPCTAPRYPATRRDAATSRTSSTRADCARPCHTDVREDAAAEKPVLQSSGILDDVEITEKRSGGAKVTVTGKGHMERLFNCDVLPSLALENMTLAGAARKLLTETMPGQTKPFYSYKQIVIDNDANRILTTGKAAAGTKLSLAAPLDLEQFKITQIKPHAGETIYDYLSRHARRFGLLIWGTADGKVVFSRPNYEQRALYNLQLRQTSHIDNNCELTRKQSFKHRASEIHVYGKGRGGDISRAGADAVVYDDEAKQAGLFRILTIHDQNARDKKQCEERGHYELGIRRQTGDVITATVEGHATDDGAVYGFDNIARIDWDKADVHGDRYVMGRTFSCADGAGTTTTLEIVPKYAIQLGSVA